MTPAVRLASAALTLAALMGAAACGQSAETPAPAEQTATIPAGADVHPFMVGELQLAALRDGVISLPVDQTPWGEGAEVAGILTAAGEAGDAVHLSVQPLLVLDGDRIVLIDTGAGGAMGTSNGLPGALNAAGIALDQVTDILISHAHGDHVGGLLTAEGTLAYPNAAIRFSAAEWAAAQAGAEAAGAGPLMAAITPRVETFEPDAQVTPSITAVSLDGHTAGHTGYRITSGSETLLYIGDAMHSSVISVFRPDRPNAWDADGAAAVATRQNLARRGSEEAVRYYAVHFPFPGLGRITRQGEGYVWTPES